MLLLRAVDTTLAIPTAAYGSADSMIKADVFAPRRALVWPGICSTRLAWERMRM